MNWRVNEKKQRGSDGESEQEKLVGMRKSRREYMEEIVILAAYVVNNKNLEEVRNEEIEERVGEQDKDPHISSVLRMSCL